MLLLISLTFPKMCSLAFSNKVTLHSIVNSAIAFLVPRLRLWESIPFL